MAVAAQPCIEIEQNGGDSDKQCGIVMPHAGNVAVQKAMDSTLCAAPRALVTRESHEDALGKQIARVGRIEGKIYGRRQHGSDHYDSCDNRFFHHIEATSIWINEMKGENTMPEIIEAIHHHAPVSLARSAPLKSPA